MIFVNPYSGTNIDIPNIGLAFAATYHATKVLDLNTLPAPRDRFLEHKTDILGISVQSRTYNESLRIKKLYMDKYPDAQVKSVSGFLDVQCCYPYISFDDDLNVEVRFGDTLPFPDYELFDSFDMFLCNWQTGRWRYAIMTSLGCPFSCTYCSAGRRRVDMRSVEHCVEELRLAKSRWGISKFVILDDCFNANKERVIKFCNMVRPLNLGWGCANGLRADRFDDDTAQALYSSGCDFISFGIESAADDILNKIGKGETIAQIEQAIVTAQKYFSVVNGYFIIGLPGSSYESDMESLRWALRLNVNAHFSYYVPFDRQMYYDSVFYGKDAEPLSEAYSKDMQKRIFTMTACMRGDYGGGAFRKAVDMLSLTCKACPSGLLKLVKQGLHRFIGGR
ncbi:MAG: radical SAM protein [Nitrospirae bacterium]|nr:MAG: radical SAM protein [Nitrospirota bacterium]